MLSTIERIIFLLAAILTAFLASRGFLRLIRVIARGVGRPEWSRIPKRLFRDGLRILVFAPVFRARRIVSFFHGMVAWGFLYFLLVNVGDLLTGYIPDFHFLGRGKLGDLYRLGGDLLSISVLTGMIAFLIRRFLLRPPSLTVRAKTLLHPKARFGIKRDSLIVGLFVLVHVAGRLLGESALIALEGADPWQPFASYGAGLLRSWSVEALEVARHVGWWLALGSILVFLPYFPYSKHLHLFMAPLNHLLRPQRRAMGELSSLDFEDEHIEQYGAEKIEHLSRSSLMDAYACIMCNRCQDACPAYCTGKVLSPAALEINKRYYLNQEGARLARGAQSAQSLLESAISAEAIWACIACAACVEICPVANEPMHDILEMRRHLVLMTGQFPEELQAAYRGMERSGNPWNVPAEERMNWATGLNIPTVAERPDAEILWWVGCAPAIDPRAQKCARAFARLLESVRVSFAVLGREERCTGDSARRSGNEYLFHELAKSNIETLNRVRPSRIMTTCPHCLHTLKNEYPAMGGHYNVIHHSQFLQELLHEKRLPLKEPAQMGKVTYHDPC